jgi:hypothetical protein
MTRMEARPTAEIVKELFAKSADGLREIVRAVMQEMLEAEMTDALGAEKGERTAARLGYRSGYTAELSSPGSVCGAACRRLLQRPYQSLRSRYAVNSESVWLLTRWRLCHIP